MSDDGPYDEVFREIVRRGEIEQRLAEHGLYVVREGEGVVGGEVVALVRWSDSLFQVDRTKELH